MFRLLHKAVIDMIFATSQPAVEDMKRLSAMKAMYNVLKRAERKRYHQSCAGHALYSCPFVFFFGDPDIWCYTCEFP